MAGRKPKLNWTPCFNQYTCTIDGVFHRLGQDQEAAETQFKFLIRQSEDGAEVDPNVTFGEVADVYLDFVQQSHTADRYRHCKERLQEFKDHVGADMKVKDLRPKHVDAWLKKKGKLTAGTERLYKAILLACLNWAARPRKKKGGELVHENPLKGQLHLPQGESRGKEAVWTNEVYEQVLRVSNPAFADLVRILAWTGARPSTVIRLEARHYNRAQSRLDCEDLYRGRSAKKHVKHVRLLHDEARALVERLCEDHPEGPLLRNSHGDPWEPDAPQIYLTNLRVKYKQTKDLVWPESLVLYGLRHTFATNFLARFPNEIEYLRVLLGHKDYTMILEHYGHLVDQHASAFKRLEGFDPFGQR